MTGQPNTEPPNDTTEAPSIDDLPDMSALLADGEVIGFDAPWQARAFAIAVVLSEYHENEYPWSEFQQELATQIEADAETTVTDRNDDFADPAQESQYYEQWLRAIEHTVLQNGLIDPEAIDQRVREFADGDRDASEFVTGEHRHSHASESPHHHEHE